MAVEIKQSARGAAEDTVETTVMGADLVTGAAVTVAENVSRAVSHPVREAHKIERRGAAANRQIRRRVSGVVDDAVETLDAVMPEKVALLGIRAVKERARRKDLVGDVAYRTLEFVNGGLEMVLGTLNRLERATEPPTRPGTTHLRPTRPVRKATRSVKRSVTRASRSTAGAARSTVRRGSQRARRTEKKA